MNVLAGRTALVTGAASGLGRSIALALARQGAHLHLADIDGEGLAETANEARAAGVEATALRCDLRDTDQIDDLVAAVTRSPRGLHVLVNNAGVIYYGNTGQMTGEQAGEVLSVNLHAPIRLTQRLLPLLLAQEEAHILNVCSLAGLVPIRKMALYQATKHALVGLSRSLRAEYRRDGRLGVTALCPGVVETGLIERARRRGWSDRKAMPFARLAASPDRVAAAAVRAIRRNRGLVVVSGHARFLWMLDRLWPGFFDVYEHWRDPLRGRRAARRSRRARRASALKPPA